jgi:FlaA1/EpsC-like NDP-sugar epimerase
MTSLNEKVLENKTILVTGGTGSMGKVLVNRILKGELGVPKKIIVLSRDEAKQHQMRLSYLHKKVSTDETIYRNFVNTLEFRIGDVRNYADVCSATKTADIVVNAAALKQVPACEYFPWQAVFTNCVGAENIVRAIQENDFPVQKVIGISTDKACKPVNVMGMTKAIQERIFTSANILNRKTSFVCVRYGNVLASRGSVIPLFHHQIEQGGPVTVTVFAAIQTAKPGETYIPNAPAAQMMNIARALIGSRKTEIKITGIRPGEKMHEIMVSEEEMHHTIRRGDYYVTLPMLPELTSSESQDTQVLKKEYSSADSVIDYDATVALLKKHELMVGEWNHIEDGELLR